MSAPNTIELAADQLALTFAERLGVLSGETRPEVLRLASACLEAVREGHVALPLLAGPDALPEAALLESPLIGQPGARRPLILENGCLYLHRYHGHQGLY